MNEMTAKYENGNVVITVPVDLLIYAEGQMRPNGGFKIEKEDTDAVGQYVADNVLEFDEAEDGTTRIVRLLDELFDEAYENGETWLELLEEGYCSADDDFCPEDEDDPDGDE